MINEEKMDVYKSDLGEFLTVRQRTFHIPAYQGNYDWQKPQCTKLFRDIETLVKEGGSHFLGTIIFVVGSPQTVWSELSIIDGQQRICSIMLLLKAIHDVTPDDNVKYKIWHHYLTNTLPKDDKLSLKFRPSEKDEFFWFNIMERTGVKQKESAFSMIYRHFKKLIITSKISSKNLLYAIGRLEIICIKLEAGKDNHQKIFESINSAGISNNIGYLILKLLLLNCQDKQIQTSLYQNYWAEILQYCPLPVIQDFIIDYLTLKIDSVVADIDVYEVFKQYYQLNFLGREEDLLKELRQFSEYYSWCKFYKSDNIELNLLLRQFHDFNSFVAFPFLMWLFDKCYKQKRLLEIELFDIIRILISYQYRRLICRSQFKFYIRPDSLFNPFLHLAQNIGDDYNIHDKTVKILADRTRSMIFPRDDDFILAFINFDIYNAKLAYYTLTMLELELNNGNKVKLFDKRTIEHIMPQALSADWIKDLGKEYERIHSQWKHTIGNLTLCTNNSKLGNLSYAEKRKYYVCSQFKLSRELASFKVWNAKNILSRAKNLFKIALIIWPFPDIPNTPITYTDNDCPDL
jgi:uncharacterized protein with ParB-like and HNH nuclease domain